MHMHIALEIQFEKFYIIIKEYPRYKWNVGQCEYEQLCKWSNANIYITIMKNEKKFNVWRCVDLQCICFNIIYIRPNNHKLRKLDSEYI